MKNSFKLIIVSTLLIGSTIISCSSSEKKVETAKENVDDAAKELEIANQEYLKDMENYKIETSKKIETNNQSIIDFNSRIANEKKDVKENYQKQINELNQQNSDLKKRMEDYQATGKENWDNFKSEFNRDMDALGSSISNFFKKDKSEN